MKSAELVRTARSKTVLVSGILALLATGVGGQSLALAGGPPRGPMQFSGLLNDYTPTTVDGTPTGTAIKGAPYEMHGVWTLDLNEQRSKAKFSAEMTMQTSEVVNTDPVYNPGTLGAHTHHISVADGVVHDGPMDFVTMCPTLKPPAAGGFVVTGTLYLTANGSNPPFGNPSPVTICILGGTSTLVPGTAYVEFSNLTLTIGAPASSHFSSLPIHGVVTRCGGQWGFRQSQSCEVAVE